MSASFFLYIIFNFVVSLLSLNTCPFPAKNALEYTSPYPREINTPEEKQPNDSTQEKSSSPELKPVVYFPPPKMLAASQKPAMGKALSLVWGSSLGKFWLTVNSEVLTLYINEGNCFLLGAGAVAQNLPDHIRIIIALQPRPESCVV